MTDKVETVESKIRSLLAAEYGVDEIGPRETFDEAGLDSLDKTELCMNVEEMFELPEMSPADEDGIETLQQLVAYVDRKRKQ
jgi:acyl carrier protein